jgi:hypothetical protein
MVSENANSHKDPITGIFELLTKICVDTSLLNLNRSSIVVVSLMLAWEFVNSWYFFFKFDSIASTNKFTGCEDRQYIDLYGAESVDDFANFSSGILTSIGVPVIISSGKDTFLF